MLIYFSFYILNFNELKDFYNLNKLILKNIKTISQGHHPQKDEPLIPRTSNYKKLYSYQKSEAIYDITWYFCRNFLKRGDRTIVQMVQAARSGKQNIVEGCSASATSKEMEIKLVNVAKASLQELLIDFENYLRTREHRQWEKDSIEMQKMREIARKHNDSAF